MPLFLWYCLDTLSSSFILKIKKILVCCWFILCCPVDPISPSKHLAEVSNEQDQSVRAAQPVVHSSSVGLSASAQTYKSEVRIAHQAHTISSMTEILYKALWLTAFSHICTHTWTRCFQDQMVVQIYKHVARLLSIHTIRGREVHTDTLSHACLVLPKLSQSFFLFCGSHEEPEQTVTMHSHSSHCLFCRFFNYPSEARLLGTHLLSAICCVHTTLAANYQKPTTW